MYIQVVEMIKIQDKFKLVLNSGCPFCLFSITYLINPNTFTHQLIEMANQCFDFE